MKHLITWSRRGARRVSEAVTGFLAFATLSVLTASAALADDPPPTLGPTPPPKEIADPFVRFINWGLFALDIVFVALLAFGVLQAATGNIDRKGTRMVTWSLVGLALINGVGYFTGMFQTIAPALFGK